MTRTVLALGGNTLVERGSASHAEQLESIRRMVHHLDPIRTEDRDAVWTHGNGPQVGNRLLEQEACASFVEGDGERAVIIRSHEFADALAGRQVRG